MLYRYHAIRGREFQITEFQIISFLPRMASALWAPLQDILETPLKLSKPLNVLELDGCGAPGKIQKYDYSA